MIGNRHNYAVVVRGVSLKEARRIAKGQERYRIWLLDGTKRKKGGGR